MQNVWNFYLNSDMNFTAAICVDHVFLQIKRKIKEIPVSYLNNSLSVLWMEYLIG